MVNRRIFQAYLPKRDPERNVFYFLTLKKFLRHSKLAGKWERHLIVIKFFEIIQTTSGEYDELQVLKLDICNMSTQLEYCVVLFYRTSNF